MAELVSAGKSKLADNTIAFTNFGACGEFCFEGGAFLVATGLAQEAEEVQETRTRQDAFVAHMSMELSSQITPEFNFQFRLRCKAAVTTFAGNRPVSFAIPRKNRFSKAGSRGQNHSMTTNRAGIGRGVEFHQFVRRQKQHSVRHGLEVVEQFHAGSACRQSQAFFAHFGPRKVCGSAPAIDNGTGHSETGPPELWTVAATGEEFGNNRLKGAVIVAFECLLTLEPQFPVQPFHQSHGGLGAANIACQIHFSRTHPVPFTLFTKASSPAAIPPACPKILEPATSTRAPAATARGALAAVMPPSTSSSTNRSR